MTGRAPDNARIVAAPEEFAALAEELRAQSTSSGTDEGDPAQWEEAANRRSRDRHWFPRLPTEKQSEVIKYAALHIAKNSKHFELTRNGGNYQEYLKLALAIARSGVADAVNIFIEAASIAKDADPEEKLRNFFQNCENADRAGWRDRGHVIPYRDQCGANFKAMEADCCRKRDPDVAMFVPGNEEACRQLLAR